MRYAAAVVLLAVLAAPAAATETYLPRAVIAAGLDAANCELPIDQVTEFDPQDLGGGLKLVQVSCWSAAYNFGGILFAVGPNARDKARLLSFQTVGDKKKLETVHSLALPQFDSKTKILSTYYKGRGVGDCGEIGEWRWTGKNFKLTGYWNKTECDGKVFDADKRDAKWRVFPFRK
jgi:Protein of unknown function (DUF1176)